jgi:hypothetical protein
MRKQIYSLALSTFFGLGIAMAAPQDQSAPSPAQAPTVQGTERHQMDPNRQLKMLTKRLNLTADQQNQILPILSDRQQQMQNIRADASLSAKDRHAKMRAVRDDSESKIKALLNDDQKATYDQMQQQRRQHMKQNAGQSGSEVR